MIRAVLALVWTCVVLMNPDGWFGWFSEPEQRTYHVKRGYDIHTDESRNMTIFYLIEGGEGRQGKIYLAPDMWSFYSCEEEEVGNS